MTAIEYVDYWTYQSYTPIYIIALLGCLLIFLSLCCMSQARKNQEQSKIIEQLQKNQQHTHEQQIQLLQDEITRLRSDKHHNRII